MLACGRSMRRAITSLITRSSRQGQRFGSTAAAPLNVLVVDGYASDARAELVAGGAATAGALYQAMLTKAAAPLCSVACDIVYPADESFVLPDLSVYDAVTWTGCSLTIFDDHDVRVAKQIAIARDAFRIGIPQFGSCWGAQIAVAAANGICARNPRGREMGIARKIALTPEGRAHPMFEGKRAVFDAFTSHNDEITHLPSGGLMLAGNAFTSVQAIAVHHLNGEFWGVQYHPEYNLHEMARLTYCRRHKLIRLGFFRDEAAADAYIDDLESLHKNPDRGDIAWRLGIDADVMEDTIRHRETRNFIKHLVLPFKQS